MDWLTACKRLLWACEVDRAVVWAALCRLWTLISGPLSILLVIRCLTPEEQGYYYTAFSLLGIKIILDLGLCTVVTQLASHEWSRLSLADDGALCGDPVARERIGRLCCLVTSWFAVGSLVLVVGLSVGGLCFFSGRLDGVGGWRWAWILLVAGTGLQLLTVPVRALLEGCNQVARMQKMNLGEQFWSKLVLFGALLAGTGIWSATFSMLMAAVWDLGWLWKHYRNFLRSLPLRSRGGLDWRREILPLQWRLGISWLANYCLGWLFTPVVFYFCGSVAAGQWGITQNLVKLVGSLAMVIMGVKLPLYGTLVAAGKLAELEARFRRGTILSLGLLFAGMGATGGGIACLEYFLPRFSERFLALEPSILLIVAEIFLASVVPCTVYLRAFKREPLYGVMAAGAAMMAGCTMFGAYRAGIYGVAWAAVFVNAGVCISSWYVWMAFRRSWKNMES